MIEIAVDCRTLDDGLQTSAHRLAPSIFREPRSEWRVTVADPITEFGSTSLAGYAAEIYAKGWVTCQHISNWLCEPAADVRTRLYVFNRLPRPA